MASSARPTSIRYIILGMTTLVAVMLYLDRWCLGFVAQDIGDQLRLSRRDVDLLQSVFYFSYAFGQIPAGWLADRFGQRTMLTLYLFSWSVLTALMGVATSLSVLLLFRLGCGLFEAGAYPACAGLVRRWMPPGQRGLGSAFVSIGGRIGGAIAFPLTAYLMVAFATRSGSPEFTARDLIAPREIAQQLVEPGAAKSDTFTEALAKHVRPHLTDAQRHFLSALAATPVETAASAGTVAQLAELLNDLLRWPDFAKGLDLLPYKAKMPAEVLTDIGRSGAAPESEQVIRRNRLLFEVALPNRVCKLYGWGWQPTVFVFGAAGVLLACMFWSFFRNRPRQHPLVNAAEAQLIEGGDAAPKKREASVPAGVLWRGIVGNRSLWICSLVQFGTNFGWVLLGTKIPEYLERVHQVPKIEQGWLLFLPYVLSVPMTMVGGAWTDWMTRRWGLWLGRAFPIASTRFLAAGAFLACILLNAPWPVTLAMCVMSVTSDMGLPALWAYNLDVGGRNVGLILGWGNMWGNLGAFASPVLLGMIQESYGWNAVFITCAVVFAVIGVASFGIDATRPIAPPQHA
jgi:MFS transporter, ACS family, glucarate transporter